MIYDFVDIYCSEESGHGRRARQRVSVPRNANLRFWRAGPATRVRNALFRHFRRFWRANPGFGQTHNPGRVPYGSHIPMNIFKASAGELEVSKQNLHIGQICRTG